MALIVLDAGVLIAHLDPGDAHHATATGLLDQWADDDLRLPASAYAESLVHPARKGQLEAARRSLDSLALVVEPITARIAERAAALRAADPALRLPDALVLACGETLGADQVVTGDRRWSRHGAHVCVIA